MSYPQVTGTGEIDTVVRLVSPWLYVGDIRRPAILADLPVGPYDFSAVVIGEREMVRTARGVRAALLSRAEDALAAVEAAGWFFTEYPAMRFDGRMMQPVATLTRKLVAPAVQHSISLRVDFAVMRL